MKKEKSKRKSPKIVENNRPNQITHVAILMDESGSMTGKEEFAVSSFNEQIQALRKAQEDNSNLITTVSFSTFETNVKPLKYLKHPLSAVEELSVEEFKPGGSTPLFDAMADIISRIKAGAQPANTAYLVIVITDGYENASRTHNSLSISSLINGLQNQGNWTFLYLGTNQDFSQVQTDMKLHKGNMFRFEDNSDGWRIANDSTSLNLYQYMSNRSVGMTSTAHFYGDIHN